MRKCNVYCVNTETDSLADILEESEYRLKVAIVGTDITITMRRDRTNRPYVGRVGGMEFETFGDME